jgi:transcriptional regulator with XRE-family HTH domain
MSRGKAPRARLQRMDDQRVGAILRAVRRRRGWRQSDVASKAGVSQTWVSLIERGHLGPASLDRLRRVSRPLDISLALDARWRGADLARLLDHDHALLVESTARLLRATGWTVLIEYTFNHFGERGSADLVAWRPLSSTLLVVEVKTRIVDVQELLGQLGRKSRVVPIVLARDQGWKPHHLAAVLVATDTTRNRRVVADHRTTFDSALPARSRVVRAWLRSPDRPLKGLLFVRPSSGSNVGSARPR